MSLSAPVSGCHTGSADAPPWDLQVTGVQHRQPEVLTGHRRHAREGRRGERSPQSWEPQRKQMKSPPRPPPDGEAAVPREAAFPCLPKPDGQRFTARRPEPGPGALRLTGASPSGTCALAELKATGTARREQHGAERAVGTRALPPAGGGQALRTSTVSRRHCGGRCRP